MQMKKFTAKVVYCTTFAHKKEEKYNNYWQIPLKRGKLQDFRPIFLLFLLFGGYLCILKGDNHPKNNLF
jgi:hypothetical protein